MEANRHIWTKTSNMWKYKFKVYFGFKWPDIISNQLLLETTKMDPIIINIKKRKWKWIGHPLRREQDNIVRKALEWNH
jgi:hypothetical protein